jgi:hypothetical protein
MSFPKLFAQSVGLNCELGFNKTYMQSIAGVAVYGEFTYVAQNISSTDFGEAVFLQKIDTLGNVIWDKMLPLYDYELPLVSEIQVTGTGDVFCIGRGRQQCDVVDAEDLFILKISPEADSVWCYITTVPNYTYSNITGFTSDSLGNVIFNFGSSASNPPQTKIYTCNSSGQVIDSLFAQVHVLDHLVNFTGYAKVGSNENILYGLASTGIPTNTKVFSTYIQSMEVIQDTLFILTSDSIFKLDTAFHILSGTTIGGFTAYSNLQVSSDKIELLSVTPSEVYIHSLTRLLQHFQTDTIPVVSGQNSYLSYNEEHFSIAWDVELFLGSVVKYLDYSRKSPENIFVHSTDIGITQMVVTDSIIQFYDATSFFLNISVDVLVKNIGNKTLNSCRLNCLKSPSYFACVSIMYKKYFTNLNLAPGESVWFSLDTVMRSFLYLSQFPSGLIQSQVCVYTSHPNYLTDLDVSNDYICKNVQAGYVGLETHTPPSNVTLRKIIDITGRETTFRPNTPLIYIYSDGSVKRVYRME